MTRAGRSCLQTRPVLLSPLSALGYRNFARLSNESRGRKARAPVGALPHAYSRATMRRTGARARAAVCYGGCKVERGSAKGWLA